MRYYLWYLFLITSLYAMEQENPCISLKMLATYLGAKKTKQVVGFKDDNPLQNAWNETVEIPDYSIMVFDATTTSYENAQLAKKSVYTFIQELEKEIPKDVVYYIASLLHQDVSFHKDLSKNAYAQSYSHYATLKQTESISAMVIEENTRTLFAGDYSKKIVCWDLDSYLYQYELEQQGTISCLAIGAEPHLLLSGSSDNIITYWNTTKKERLFTLPLGHTYTYPLFITYNPESKDIFYASADCYVGKYNNDTKKHDIIINGHRCLDYNTIFVDIETDIIVYADNCNIIFFKSDENFYPQKIKNTATLYKKPNSNIIYSGSYDNKIYQWDITDTNPINVTHKSHDTSESVLTLTYDTQADFLISGLKDTTINIYNPVTMQCLATYKHEAFKTEFNSVVALAHDSKTGTIISGAHDGTLNIWKPQISYEAMQKQSLSLTEYLILHDLLKE